MINGIRLDEQRVTVYDDMRSQIQQTDSGSTAAKVTESAQNVLKAPEMAENQAAAGGVNAAVQKALEEAGLPKNERNSGIVRQMLENQMSIDKDSLSRVVQQANMFREADISTLLLMNKNNMPVTHFTAAQLQAYINNEQNLSEQMGDVINSLMEYLAGDAASGTPAVNIGVLELLTGTNEAIADAAGTAAEVTAAQVAAENIEALAGGEANVMNVLMTGQGGSEAVIAAAGQGAAANVEEAEVLNMLQTESVTNVINELGTDAEGSGANWMNGFGTDESGLTSDAFNEYNMDNGKGSLTANAGSENTASEGQEVPLSSLLSESEINELNSLQSRLFGKEAGADPDASSAQVLKNIYENINNLSEAELKELFQSEPYRKLIGKALGEKFTLNAEDIDSADSINDYYKETFKALSKLQEMVGKDSAMADKLSKPMDNMKFMDTLNNVFPYIQLPLKLNEGKTHGELYVFKKGRNNADPGDSKSVLLHLDMDSLGPTDVHMELKSGFLKLRFYCENELSKNILSDHFRELETALSNKNFQVTSEFNVRTVETRHMVEALSGGSENLPEFKYNFDIRA